MENQEQKIKLWGPTGFTETTPDEAEILLTSGYRPATEEEIKFSTTPETIKGVGEAVGRGLGGVFFTAAERALGVDPKSIENRQKISVGEDVATAVELGTMLVPTGIIGKAGKLLEAGEAISPLLKAADRVSKFTFPGALDVAGNLASKGIEGAAAKLAMKYGVENALYSVSDDFGKKLVSDKPEDVHEVLSGALAHAALSGLVGAGLGYGVGKLSPLWKAKEGSKVANAIDQIKVDTAPEVSMVKTAPIAEEKIATEIPVEAAKEAEKVFEKPTTMEGVEKLAKELGEVPLEPFEAPELKSVNEANARLGPENLKVPILETQLKAIEDPVVRKNIENIRATNPEIDRNLGIIEGHQKAQSERGIWNTIKQLSPNFIKEPLEAGKKWTNKIVSNVFKTADNFETQFRKFDEMGVNALETTTGIFNKLEEQFPGLKNLYTTTKKGKFTLKPYNLKMPITKEAHQALAEMLPLLKEETLSLGEIRSIRKNIYSFINFSNKESQREIGIIRNALMDTIQESVEKIDPSFEVRKLFQDYALHKEAVDMAESLLGSAITKEGPKDQFLASEKLVKALFSDTGKIGFLKQLLPENEFNELLGDYLAINLQNATKEGSYSSRLFGNWLKREMPELLMSFENRTELLQKIQDFNTIAKLVPDGVRMFPSRSGEQAYQTTKPLIMNILGKLRGLGALLSMSPEVAATSAAAQAAKKAAEMAENRALLKQNEQLLNAILSGGEKQAGAASLLRTLKDWSKSTNAAAFESLRQYLGAATKGTYLITKEVKTIFDSDKPAQLEKQNTKQLEKLDRKIQDLGSNPEQLLNVGGEIGYYAPEHATAIGMTSARVVNYLNQKRPTPKKNGPLDKEIPPSRADMNNYYRTLNLAENPTVILQRIKNGTVHSRDVVDLKNLYPELYDSFLIKLSNELASAQTKGKQIPFRIKKGLSIYAGSPLDSTMSPQSIQSAQAVFQPQQQPQQQALPQMAKKSSRKSQLPNLTETDQQRRMLNR